VGPRYGCKGIAHRRVHNSGEADEAVRKLLIKSLSFTSLDIFLSYSYLSLVTVVNSFALNRRLIPEVFCG
jgi:hypothetical protein